MGYETIVVSREGGVATITLNRPKVLNAYNVQMGAELFGALHELDLDDAIRAIVVTGAGRAFCAGADLSAGADTFAGAHTWEQVAEAEEKVRPWNMRTPVIAAIGGAAVGIGATLPLQWDIRIAADDARIGFVFTRRGIAPEAGSTWILPRLIGFAAASELLLTGRTITAREALRLGLVSQVVRREELLYAAQHIAREIARHTAPMSVAITKRLLWHQLVRTDPRRAKEVEDRLFEWIGRQPDAAEGVDAFLEKRPPRYRASTAELPRDVDRWPGPSDEDEGE